MDSQSEFLKRIQLHSPDALHVMLIDALNLGAQLQSFDGVRHLNSPPRPGKTLPGTGLQTSGLTFLDRLGPGKMLQRLQDHRALQS
jgi:hypothetical protein